MRIEPVDQNAQLDNLNPQNNCLDYGELILPAAFTDAMSLEQQIFWLLVHKEDRLKAGENITLTKNQDGTVTVSATGGSSSDTTYRIIEVEPESGYVAAYALQNIDTQQISGETIQIPEGGSATTPVITATASVDSSTGTPSVDVSKTGSDEAPNFAFAFHNLKGETGASGRDGSNGEPGFSPSANIQQTSNGAIVTITDEFGTTQAEITNGSDGAQGQSGADGFSPIANIQQTSSGAIITITDSNGTTTATINNGQNGESGDDGVGISGIAFKETDAQGNNIYTVTLTDGTTYDITCARGPRGEQGPQGIPGTGEDGVGISNIAYTREDAQGNYVYTVTLSNNQTYEITTPRGPQGVQGVQGNPGVQGDPGPSGSDGFSPIANVTSITNGVRITITDENGTTTQDVMNGSDGSPGAPGYSPTANIQQTSSGAIITITDSNGTTTATITNGQSGSNGVGISGITFKETDAQGNNVYTVTLTDGSTYDITSPKGATGSTGPAGPGVPSGGTDGQVLTKDGSTDYATKWATPSSGGGITKIHFSGINYASMTYRGIPQPSLSNFGISGDIFVDSDGAVISTNMFNGRMPWMEFSATSSTKLGKLVLTYDMSGVTMPSNFNGNVTEGTAIIEHYVSTGFSDTYEIVGIAIYKVTYSSSSKLLTITYTFYTDTTAGLVPSAGGNTNRYVISIGGTTFYNSYN